uniref:CHH preproprotein n=1 Tax=Euphausia crystallorophias TaxID=48141 RepID=A0A1W5LU40_9EUCA|nr:CHH preproprotein [Euphausia crystallorophias]
MTNTIKLSILTVALVSCCLSPLVNNVSARNIEPLNNDAMASLLSVANFKHVPAVSKRSIFDPSCKGFYNKEVFKKLNHICDDCYNLYRDASVAVKCKENCFGNPVFEQCIYELLIDDQVDELSKIVRTLGK